MYELIATIDNPSIAENIRQAVAMLKGVSSVRVVQRDLTPEEITIRAIEEARDGKGQIFRTDQEFDDYLANLTGC